MPAKTMPLSVKTAVTAKIPISRRKDVSLLEPSRTRQV
jgi:hypothetical protein